MTTRNGHITYEELCLWDDKRTQPKAKTDITARLEKAEGTSGLLQLAKACIEKRGSWINYEAIKRFLTDRYAYLLSLETYQELYGEVDPDFVHSED